MKNLICVSAPSGSGKTTLCKAIRKLRPDLVWSVSCTTREPRNGEVDGEDYHFKTKQEFLAMIEKGEFAEWENVHENYYGTLKESVEDHLRLGEDVLFDIDWQGTQQLIDAAREDVVSIFILPPSRDELYRRLLNRELSDKKIADDKSDFFM